MYFDEFLTQFWTDEKLEVAKDIINERINNPLKETLKEEAPSVSDLEENNS